MNRKLHNSMLAFSATGLVLALALLAAGPAPVGMATRDVALSTPAAAGLAEPAAAANGSAGFDAAAVDASARRIEARAQRLEAELERSASLGDTIASAVSFAAALSSESALGVALEATGDALQADDAEERREAERERRRHVRKVRSALAVPYFSFAQGLRRSRS